MRAIVIIEGKTGTIATRPDAFCGHNMGDATSILGI